MYCIYFCGVFCVVLLEFDRAMVKRDQLLLHVVCAYK